MNPTAPSAGRLAGLRLAAKFLAMLTQVTRLLIALIVAFGMTIPTGVDAMAMADGMMGQSVDRPCQHCPQPQDHGGITPHKMPACTSFACLNAAAVIPAPVRLPGLSLAKTAYSAGALARRAGAAPAPDPFPPRPVVLR
jgi:hypothetical protein